MNTQAILRLRVHLKECASDTSSGYTAHILTFFPLAIQRLIPELVLDAYNEISNVDVREAVKAFERNVRCTRQEALEHIVTLMNACNVDLDV